MIDGLEAPNQSHNTSPVSVEPQNRKTKVVECLLKTKAFVIKKVANRQDDPALRAGPVTWSKFGGCQEAWQECKRRAGWIWRVGWSCVLWVCQTPMEFEAVLGWTQYSFIFGVSNSHVIVPEMGDDLTIACRLLVSSFDYESDRVDICSMDGKWFQSFQLDKT